MVGCVAGVTEDDDVAGGAVAAEAFCAEGLGWVAGVGFREVVAFASAAGVGCGGAAAG